MTHKYDLEGILNSTHLVPFSKNYKIEEFVSKIEEYSLFLKKSAEEYEDKHISQTQLLLDNKTGDIVGYFSLCTASIILLSEEKEKHGIQGIQFNSIPVLKIGKLAVNENYRSVRKGYGSFLIELVRGLATEINQSGVACRFIVVDADVEHNPDTVDFYTKNGFSYNENYQKSKGTKKTISMRLDIYEESNEESEEQQIIS